MLCSVRLIPLVVLFVGGLMSYYDVRFVIGGPLDLCL